MDLDVPFHDYPSHLRFLRGNLARGRDNFLGIEGPEGSGKSTIGMNVVLDLKPDFSVDRDVIFTNDQLIQALDEGRKRQVYYLDEAVNIFYNRDWSTWEAKDLTRMARQMRVMESTWVAVIPDYEGLDPYLREKRIRTRIYQPPYYDSDGMTNGPAKVLWKTERFDYTDQRVTHRWVDVYDLEVHSLEGHPAWATYNGRKVDNFHGLVQAFRKRLKREQDREDRRDAREAAPAKTGKAKRSRAPPTTM